METYKEIQKFKQWWLWLILIFMALIPIYGIYKQLYLGEKFGNNPISDTGLILISILMFGLIVLLWFTRLRTEIDNEGIKIVFFPFTIRYFSWADIKKAEIVDYGFIGGWGVRSSKKYGKVYNMKGEIGLALELENGKKLLIGTQNEEELKEYINQLNN